MAVHVAPVPTLSYPQSSGLCGTDGSQIAALCVRRQRTSRFKLWPPCATLQSGQFSMSQFTLIVLNRCLERAGLFLVNCDRELCFTCYMVSPPSYPVCVLNYYAIQMTYELRYRCWETHRYDLCDAHSAMRDTWVVQRWPQQRLLQVANMSL